MIRHKRAPPNQGHYQQDSTPINPILRSYFIIFNLMKKFLVIALVFFAVQGIAQKKEYVCQPCGSDCDKIVYDKPGACPSCNMRLIDKASIQFENLSAEEFCARITANPEALILDVRSKSEFDGSALGNTYGRFRKAINIHIQELEARMSELEEYKDKEVLVYCSHSVRSPRAAILLNSNGFANVKNMDGGVSTLKPKGDTCLQQNYIVH
jgi:rhodanese-related sulfurtransferase/DNA-directed RNA polymerase subunit RPC12/RpoP